MVAFLRSDYLLCACVEVDVYNMYFVHLHLYIVFFELADHLHVHVFLRFQQILLYYMEHMEYELVMETCKKHG